jgi:hypothetical protein
VVDRILRAIRLDWTVFREIAEDQSAMSQAAIIVVVVTFLSAVGNAIATRSVVGALLGWIVAILIGWIGWAILTYFVGTLLFKGKTDIPEMMRVLGYASVPQVLGFFVFIPCLGAIASFIGAILALIAGVFAIREAMEFDTGKAIVTVVISWIIVIVITIVLGLLGLGGAALIGGGLGG